MTAARPDGRKEKGADRCCDFGEVLQAHSDGVDLSPKAACRHELQFGVSEFETGGTPWDFRNLGAQLLGTLVPGGPLRSPGVSPVAHEGVYTVDVIGSIPAGPTHTNIPQSR